MPRILYASGSGVYGDLGEIGSDRGPWARCSRCRPTAPASWPARRSSPPTPSCSTLAAGVPVRQRRRPRQTHGVGFDFVRRLLEDPSAADDPRRRTPVQVLRARDRHRRRRANGRGRSPAAVRRLQRGHRRLHHGAARSPARRRGARPGEVRPTAVRRAATGLEGRRAGGADQH